MLLTTKEIALKWGVSVTWVTVLCKKGRIEGAIREGNRWYIPEDAKKPEDKRSCKNAPAKARFRFIDLFAGVGGFHQAMRYLGGECVMAAEVNEECKKTYRLNYHTEEKEIRGDVREIDPTTIAPFDVLCAGFPCQPFSKAGAQRGFQDKTRGNLFYTIMDILDAHPEVKFVILENVRNLADKTENWDIITSELTQRNFYITEEPIILSPSDFGIPQIRERVYILGIRKDIRNEKILSNGFIHKTDLQLEKHFKKCKMGDAWTILEDNVDDTYIISQEQEQMIYAWDEFRIGTGLKVIGFPVWIDSFGVGIDDDNEVFHSQGYDLFDHRNINDLIPEIIYYYLFQGLSLTAIEYKLFKTNDYHGWLSKTFLNYYGIDTEKENKGIYADRSVPDVVDELYKSSNIAHVRVAKLLKEKYL